MEKNSYRVLNDYLLALQRIDSLAKMDEFIAEINSAAEDVYSCISCKSGCFDCCTGPSLPTVFAKEWQRIRAYLTTLPEEQKEQIKNNTNKYFEKHSELLEFIHKMVLLTATKEELFKYAKSLVNDLKEEKCPLHLDGKCAIYPVRPTKCRAFGYFSFAFENKVTLLTCDSDNKKMNDFLVQQGTKQTVLPFWNAVERKLNTIGQDTDELFSLSVIPYWLKTDLESGLF